MIGKIFDSIRDLVNKLIPILEYRKADKEIDRKARVSEYKDSLQVGEYSGDLESFLSTVEEAHRSELDRSNRLDAKAGNYLGNVGVVLSILSLGPILTVVLQLDRQTITSGGVLSLLALAIFGYAVLALLLSAYFSAMALKMRGYGVYFTSDEMKNWLKSGDIDQREVVEELLVCKKYNEESNLEKTNAISVAGTLTRNGLVALGLGIGLILVNMFSLNPILSYLCSLL